MKNLIYKILVASVAGFLAFSFSACGDSDSGSVVNIDNPDDEGDEDDENESSSSSVKKSSSSSKKVTTSSSKKESSSSEKTEAKSSSGSKKFSSSSKEVKPKSSSSSKKATSSSSSSYDVYGGHDPRDFGLETCVTEGFVTTLMGGRNEEPIMQICHDGHWVNMSSSSSEAYFHYSFSEQFNPDVEYTKVKDSENNTYKVVHFEGYRDGDYEDKVEIEFLAENLNIGTQVTKDVESFDDEKIEKYCYGDETYFCDRFGGLYTWSEAMGFPKACDDHETGTPECPNTLINHSNEINWDTLQFQGICPDGWHIMNKSEWDILSRGSTYVGDMISSDFGNGNDDGLSLLPTGLLDLAGNDPDYSLIGDWGYLWLPREDIATKAFLIKYSTTKWFSNDKVISKKDAIAVRCVKNHK